MVKQHFCILRDCYKRYTQNDTRGLKFLVKLQIYDYNCHKEWRQTQGHQEFSTMIIAITSS